MKNFILLFFVVVLISACKNEATTITKDKTIDRAFICFEKPFNKKNNEIYIGLRYFKNYTEKDNISLTVDGKAGQELGFRVDELEGTNYIFRFAGLGNNTDVKVSLNIDNGQKVFSQEKMIRIVENYSLETIWNNFEDYNYMVQSLPLMVVLQPNNFSLVTSAGVVNGLSLGFYNEKVIPNQATTLNPFIPSLNGSYLAEYNDLKRLTNITIINGEVNVNPAISYDGVINDLKTTYGQPISITNDNNGFKITKFESGRFQILAYERKSRSTYYGITTVINLK